MVEVAGVEPASWVLSSKHIYKFSLFFLELWYKHPTNHFNYSLKFEAPEYSVVQFMKRINFYLFLQMSSSYFKYLRQ